MLTYHKTTEEEKYRITAWKYDGDYAVYNSTPYAHRLRLCQPEESLLFLL